MRYHNITKDDMLNGDGLRVVLWLSGCDHCCEDCQNPVTWDPNGGLLFDEAAKAELFEALDKDYISGITFSGGDPLYMGNRGDVTALAQEIRRKFPNKTQWLYTGYTWEQVAQLPVMSLLDVVIDGEYDKNCRNVQAYWRGSDNQRVIDVKASIASGHAVLFCE